MSLNHRKLFGLKDSIQKNTKFPLTNGTVQFSVINYRFIGIREACTIEIQLREKGIYETVVTFSREVYR